MKDIKLCKHEVQEQSGAQLCANDEEAEGKLWLEQSRNSKHEELQNLSEPELQSQ